MKFKLSTDSRKQNMIPKNRVRLSRHLHAQTTPYPEAKLWIKRGFVLLIFVLAFGIYFFARPAKQPPLPSDTTPKQILGEQKKPAEYEAYQIKKGDTLFNLSQKLGLSWQTLARINNLKEPYILKIGQTLQIPATK